MADHDLGIPGLVDARLVGEGGFGRVFAARQEAFHREVAIKILDAKVTDERSRIRFERECAALGRLSDHPNIVTVYGNGFDGQNHPYIMMEHLTGGSYADRIKEHGPLPWDDAVAVGIAIAGALETAHRAGILHRDVKPENILTSSFDQPTLVDFGIARLEGGPATTTGKVTTSIPHAAPEVLGGGEPEPTWDTYALASTLFTLVSGRYAFILESDQGVLPALRRIAEDPVPDLRPQGIPHELCRVIETGMAKRREDRYQSALAMGRALQQVQRGHGESITPLIVPGEPPTPPLGERIENVPTVSAQTFAALPTVDTPQPGWADAALQQGQAPPPGQQWGQTPPPGQQWGQTPQPGQQWGQTPQPGQQWGQTPQPGQQWGQTPPPGQQWGQTPPPGQQWTPSPTGGGGNRPGLIVLFVVLGLAVVGGVVALVLSLSGGGDDVVTGPTTEPSDPPPAPPPPPQPQPQPQPPQPQPPPPPGQPGTVPLTLGETVTAALTEEQTVIRYGFEGFEGELLTVSMTAIDAGLDPLLRLLDAAGEEVARDDDGGDGLDALLTATLPADGQYTIEATSFLESSTGAFELLATVPGAGDQILVLEEDGTVTDGATPATVAFEAFAGETLTISVRPRGDANPLRDPRVALLDPSGTELARDDDGGEGLNPLLTYTVPSEGTYTASVDGFAGGTGDFTITIVSG